MAPLVFLNTDDVIAIHADTIAHEGGLDGVRDLRLLEAAVAMPRQQFGGAYLHETLYDMAAAYHFHLSQNHPFHDATNLPHFSPRMYYCAKTG